MTKIHLLEGCYLDGDADILHIVDTNDFSSGSNVTTVTGALPASKTSSMIIPLIALAAAYMVLK